MDKKLKKIIESSTFQLKEGDYIYAKAEKINNLDNNFMISRDEDEITIITKKENSKKLDLIERNKEIYKLIALNIQIPFYAVGFLAAISNAIAAKNMNILIISTYSKDYILVKKECQSEAIKVLLSLGFKQI
ncbi:hypothetical protein A2Y83_00070 [Candidatus Falkowbacteria bacterium RBG_13_39_14]|uniref:CASTOR ACT domain-containing protein n=1 Tax=Candidatus Falkowbacteria bacterium RBG_13_39_14 TaxID=1797985 RepID=A0A1F5S341_9BACT|nr:MAG: hypothetical protein A2Y83_00070 [Candidatus Falkowbacteria bacterium RBG_13_39_14]